MLRNPLRLAEERILAEQLRFIMEGLRIAFWPVVMAIFLMVSILIDTHNAHVLVPWGVAATAANLNTGRLAREFLRAPLASQGAHGAVYSLMFALVLEGLAWGALAWIALDGINPGGSFVVLAVIAAMAGGAVSVQAAIPAVYVALGLPMGVLVLARLWYLGGDVHNGLTWLVLLFAVLVVGQALRFSRTVRKSIELRFENEALLEQLRETSTQAEESRQLAETSNVAKSKFLAAASHDLRQPVHALGLFLDVLSRTELSAVQRELVTNASAAGRASAEMLEVLLDFSRIEAGVVEPHVQPFAVQPLLNRIEREFAGQADAKGLEYRSRESDLVLASDPALVEFILRNLVSNAIRYTARGGLLVTCRLRGGQAMLAVHDTGIGIEASQQRAVFREFHQLGNPERDRTKGLGLGLAIVDGLVRALGPAHGLGLVSRPGRGSVFSVTLPISDAAPTAQASPALDDNPPRLRARVMVVDDDDTVRRGMVELLRDWGCECQAAGSLDEALTLAQTWVPEAVVSDYRLRDHVTGVEVIAALRAQLMCPLPALLISGDTAPQRLREAVGSGLPLLHKPVSPGLLYRELVTVLMNDAASSTP